MPEINSLIGRQKRTLLGFISFCKNISKRQYLEVAGTLIGLALVMWITTLITPYRPQANAIFYNDSSSTTTYLRARVDSVEADKVKVTLLDGPNKHGQRTVEHQMGNNHKYSAGNVVLVSENAQDDALRLVDRYRIPGLIILIAIFIALVLLIGRRRGMSSLIGLAVSIIVIVWFILPLILSGRDALWVSVVGAYMIAFSSIIIAHGLKLRTIISLGCVVSLLTLVALGAYMAVHLLGFTGINSETSTYLAFGIPQIDLAGVLVGGIIIASLGVLDDIVTAQVAAVDELLKANPTLSVKELYIRGSSVGGEHIASLVNTLALVYVGAALPVIIVLASYDNLMLLINREFLATEIVRTFIASSGLVLAVPFSTITAAMILHRVKAKELAVRQ